METIFTLAEDERSIVKKNISNGRKKIASVNLVFWYRVCVSGAFKKQTDLLPVE